MFNNYITKILDFILPRLCSSCNKNLSPSEDTLCNDCLCSIKLANPQFIESEYQKKFAAKRIISDFASLYIFEKEKELQHTIHALKYDKKFRIGIFLGRKLGEHFLNKIENWSIEFIIPIPLHRLKKAERGFNQSYYIAKGFSKAVNIPIKNSILTRSRFTKSQTTMNLKEREENVDGAFKVQSKEKVRAKNILLVDDVMTTGATVSECGKVLKAAGANAVYAATIALAEF